MGHSTLLYILLYRNIVFSLLCFSSFILVSLCDDNEKNSNSFTSEILFLDIKFYSFIWLEYIKLILNKHIMEF